MRTGFSQNNTAPVGSQTKPPRDHNSEGVWHWIGYEPRTDCSDRTPWKDSTCSKPRAVGVLWACYELFRRGDCGSCPITKKPAHAGFFISGERYLSGSSAETSVAQTPVQADIADLCNPQSPVPPLQSLPRACQPQTVPGRRYP